MKISSAYIFFYGGENRDQLIVRLSTSDEGVSMSDSKIAILKTLIDTSNPYKIIVVANGVGAFSMDDLLVNSHISLLYEKLTTATAGKIPSPATTPRLMSGVVEHNFTMNPIVKIDLVRQVVKFLVTVKLKKSFFSTTALSA